MTLTHPAKKELKTYSLKEIARLIAADLHGDGDYVIVGASSAFSAKPGDLIFLSDPAFLPAVQSSKALSVIARKGADVSKPNVLYVDNPSLAFDQVLRLFHTDDDTSNHGIHPTAVIGSGACIADNVSVGAYCVLDENVTLGEGSFIGPFTWIGANTRIGKNCCLKSHVSLYPNTILGDRVQIHSGSVIGSDGFGYETTNGSHQKLKHIGRVQIDDDCEIGANVTIDRARLDKTWVQRGTKIDNLVQIAHNVVLGQDNLIISQSGISGSAKLGDRVLIAGQVGVTGHIKIGNDVIVGAQAGVTKDVADKQILLGAPAKPIAEQKRLFAYIARLPELFKDVAAIKKLFEKNGQ